MSFKILCILFLLIIITIKSYQKVTSLKTEFNIIINKSFILKMKIIRYSNFQATFHPEFISNFTVDWSLHDNDTNKPAEYVEPFIYYTLKDVQNLKVS